MTEFLHQLVNRQQGDLCIIQQSVFQSIKDAPRTDIRAGSGVSSTELVGKFPIGVGRGISKDQPTLLIEMHLIYFRPREGRPLRVSFGAVVLIATLDTRTPSLTSGDSSL